MHLVLFVLALGSQQGHDACLVARLLYSTCDGGELVHEVLLTFRGRRESFMGRALIRSSGVEADAYRG